MGLEKLFEPARIGTLEIRNRIVMSPMVSDFADKSGAVSDQLIAYYAERAKGGVGLICVEGTSVAPEGRLSPAELCIYDDSFIPGLSRLAQAIEKHGAKCSIQLLHSGRRVSSRATGIQPVAPSAIAAYHGETPRELTLEDIQALIEAYAAAAWRARQAGFDAVDVHCGHGHLVAQFLSPLTNKRTDKYGGDLESRARFALDIFRAIRDKVGSGYPVTARINGDEYVKGGFTLRDAKVLAHMLEDRGVNAILTGASYLASSEEGYIGQSHPASPAPMSYPRGCFVHLAQAIKENVSIPVAAFGRINDPGLAEQVLQEGKADLIMMGRPLLADPELPKKAFEGRFEDVRKCIACNTCLTPTRPRQMRCAVNAELGREGSFGITPATKVKKVLIAGGGPAAMEAARVAALRGHRVVLCEKGHQLGGNLIAASAVSFKKEIRELLAYFSTQLSKLGVEIRLGTEVGSEVVDRLKPDAVVVATGARPVLPSIPGIERGHVTDAVAVLSGKADVGRRVVVVGGGMVGCETAAFLAEKGKQVTLVSRRSSDFSTQGGLAPDMEPLLRRWFLFEYWPNLDIRVIANAHFEEITDQGLLVRGKEGARRLIEGDTVVFAVGLASNTELAAALKGRVAELYQIGDCREPRKIVDAIHEGATVGRSI